MPELTLSPFSARLHWRLAAPVDGPEWAGRVVAMIGAIAENAIAGGATLIGHIKAMTEDGGARVSAVSAARAPEVSGAFPDGGRELVMDLVVLVYGLERDAVRRATRQALDGSVTMDEIEPAHAHDHGDAR
jgi:hypothetical protein